MKRIYEIADANMAEFEKAMNRISRKTGSLIRWLPVGKIVKDGFGYTKVRIYAHAVPEFDGWRFVAHIERNRKRNIVIPATETIDPKWYETDIVEHCDHCHIKRHRTVSYVIEKDGVRKIVGSTCVKDFFGGLDPAKVAAFFETLRSIEKKLAKYERPSRLIIDKKVDWFNVFPSQELAMAYIALHLAAPHFLPDVAWNLARIFFDNPDIRGVVLSYSAACPRLLISDETIDIARRTVNHIVNSEYESDRDYNNLISVLRDGIISRKNVNRIFKKPLFERAISEVFPDFCRSDEISEQKGYDEIFYGKPGETKWTFLELDDVKVAGGNCHVIFFRLHSDNRVYRIVAEVQPQRWKIFKYNGYAKGDRFKACIQIRSHHQKGNIKSTLVELKTFEKI